MSLAEQNNKAELKKQMNKSKDEVLVSEENCFYFYQVLGECIFLHPLCMSMLVKEHKTLPLTIQAERILESESPSSWPDFLGHLPPASSPQLVEISM